MRKDTAEKIKRMFADRRRLAEDAAAANYEKARADEMFAALDNRERALSFETGRDAHFGKDVSEKIKELEQIRAAKVRRLAALGMQPSSLEPAYQCPKCRDTGYVGGKRCACLQNAIAAELTKDSNILSPSWNFGSFSAMSKAQEKTAEKLRTFLGEISSPKQHNILLIGPTGTGKTYLITCLANEMLKKEFGVLFLSAFGLNKIMLGAHLAPVEQKEEILRDIMETDALVIDDLGSENILRNVTAEYLCNLLNERAAAGRFTFVTSNLDAAAIQNRYGDRILSRLVSAETLKIRLDGADLRLTKNEK